MPRTHYHNEAARKHQALSIHPKSNFFMVIYLLELFPSSNFLLSKPFLFPKTI